MVALLGKEQGDDNAPEWVRKTLSGSASCMQLAETTSTLKSWALSVLEQAKSGCKGDRQRLDVIMPAIRGRRRSSLTG